MPLKKNLDPTSGAFGGSVKNLESEMPEENRTDFFGFSEPCQHTSHTIKMFPPALSPHEPGGGSCLECCPPGMIEVGVSRA